MDFSQNWTIMCLWNGVPTPTPKQTSSPNTSPNNKNLLIRFGLRERGDAHNYLRTKKRTSEALSTIIQVATTKKKGTKK
jgi:hypothetical protein